MSAWLTVPSIMLFGFVAAVTFSSCGCAPPGQTRTTVVPGAVILPDSFKLSAPWESGKTHRIIRGYNVSTHRGVNRELRSNDAYALDFDLETGDAVLPVASGTVLYAGPARGGWASYGNIVMVQHEAGLSSLYAHLESVSVQTGQPVQRDTQLGEAGGSGGVRPHLHLALYSGAQLADGPDGVGPYGGASVVPEPFGPESRVGLAAGQCLES